MYEVSYPQSIVRINGRPVPFVDWEIDSNSSDTADTFTLKLVSDDLNKTPISSEYIFYTTDDLFVEIFLGFGVNSTSRLNESQMNLMIGGFVDTPSWDFSDGSLTLKGRDKTGLLLDNRVSGKFINKTVEDLIRQYATSRGLGVNIDPSIAGHTKIVGKVSNGEFTLLADGYTEWDLLLKLADEENRDLYVQGNTLNYGPRVAPSDKDGLRFKQGDSLVKLVVERTLKHTKGVSVTVKSWNKQSKTTNVYKSTSAPDVGRTTQQSNAGSHKRNYKQNYTLNIPNLTPLQVKERADNLARDIHDHEITIRFTVPTRLGFSVRKSVFIDDIPILAKQTFTSKKITTKFSVSDGVRSDFECVNHILASKGKHR